MNEKKRERIIKVCKVVAVVMAVLMIFGVVFQGFVY